MNIFSYPPNLALGFAAVKHRHQFRRDNKTPYITHCIRVANIVDLHAKLDLDYTNLMCAAYLHDTLEDTATTYDELVEHFNHSVANLVVELTNSPDGEKLKGYDKDQYILDKMLSMSDSALLVKLADRLDNTLDQLHRKNYLRRNMEILDKLTQQRVIHGSAVDIAMELSDVIQRNL
jgi:guanosine-3',5'-bis(diphosphate) 3'-pyrophosphohydrolase